MDAVVCRSCRRPLNFHRDDDTGEVTWLHPHAVPGTTEHDPDPVLMGRADAVAACDFCGVFGVTWSYPAESFEMDAEWGSQDDWAACEECHALIEADDWAAVAERTMVRLPGDDPELRRHLRQLHARFVEHRLGPALRFVQ